MAQQDNWHDASTSASARLRRWISDPDAALIVTVVADVGLAVGAFTLSFDALRELALAAGLRAELAWIWPLLVDGFIVVSTINAVVLTERIPRAAWYPAAALVTFALVSVAGNALHAARHADTDVITTPVAAVVSAIPAIALLISSHLIVVLLVARRRGAAHNDDEPIGVHRRPGRPEYQSVNNHPVPRDGSIAVGMTRAPAGKGERLEPGLVPWVRGELTEGRKVTGTDVAAFLGVSPATGRRRLHVVRQHYPDLAPALTTRHLNGSQPHGTA